MSVLCQSRHQLDLDSACNPDMALGEKHTEFGEGDGPGGSALRAPDRRVDRRYRQACRGPVADHEQARVQARMARLTRDPSPGPGSPLRARDAFIPAANRSYEMGARTDAGCLLLSRIQERA
jgi:hypothetical protein